MTKLQSKTQSIQNRVSDDKYQLVILGFYFTRVTSWYHYRILWYFFLKKNKKGIKVSICFLWEVFDENICKVTQEGINEKSFKCFIYFQPSGLMHWFISKSLFLDFKYSKNSVLLQSQFNFLTETLKNRGKRNFLCNL